jgi:hypothetical protein
MPVILGYKNQEDSVSKPAWAIVCKTLSQKYPMQKSAGRVAQVLGNLCSKPSAAKKEEKRKLRLRGRYTAT